MNPLYERMETSVFERMSLAAAKHGAINLGQGFPDFGWPREILDAAAKAVVEGSNQYAPSRGLPLLREAVAAHYIRHQKLGLSAENICVTSGATEALAAAILATVEPGDEVIIFTPAYDAYAPLIRRAGGLPIEVALQPPGWRIERAALAAAISPKTRAIIFNNPHNPTGRLFDADELAVVAEIAVDNDLVVISDEVWEHIILDPPRNGEGDRREAVVEGGERIPAVPAPGRGWGPPGPGGGGGASAASMEAWAPAVSLRLPPPRTGEDLFRSPRSPAWRNAR